MTVLALLLTVGAVISSTPAKAIVYPPCDEICPDQPGSTKCSCPAGTNLAGRTVTCSSADWDCFYID